MTYRLALVMISLEELDGTRMLISGHREELAQTLRDWVDDVNNANCSGPSCRTNFAGSTGNSTRNSQATIRQHTLQDKAVQNIDLVGKNYALESSLHETQGQMAAILAQNQTLQEWLAIQDSKHLLSLQDGTRTTISGH